MAEQCMEVYYTYTGATLAAVLGRGTWFKIQSFFAASLLLSYLRIRVIHKHLSYTMTWPRTVPLGHERMLPSPSLWLHPSSSHLEEVAPHVMQWGLHFFSEALPFCSPFPKGERRRGKKMAKLRKEPISFSSSVFVWGTCLASRRPQDLSPAPQKTSPLHLQPEESWAKAQRIWRFETNYSRIYCRLCAADHQAHLDAFELPLFSFQMEHHSSQRIERTATAKFRGAISEVSMATPS